MVALTLLLKNAKTTTFLSVTPTTKLSTIRKDLLSHLRENETHLTEITVPENETQIELGAPIDVNDLSGGFHVLPEKGTVKEVLGDRDWTVVAWRVKGGRFAVEVPLEEEEEV